ncbi:MAG: hypothetical protein F6K63_34785 [Moorea sp. SIO1G6]|uniref:hypothetical protein n=1 Tax=Moorena sp. SIO1G6 TaxID=2607840 RepID=UPI0013C09071|nr:hypothetical protein [Moorena sp. SIO1G6]NET69284.1 hypothetical protein [Moorena sp. SIO1G6]
MPPTCPCHQHAHATNMPMPPTCPFHQDAHATKMPMPATCPFHQHARSTHQVKQLLGDAPFGISSNAYSLRGQNSVFPREIR